MRRIGRVLLVVFVAGALLGSAFLKLAVIRSLNSTLVGVAIIEVIAAISILLPRTRAIVSWIMVWGLSGACAMSLVRIAQGFGSSPCGCLGRVDLSRSQSLILQGVLLAATLALSSIKAERSIPEGAQTT